MTCIKTGAVIHLKDYGGDVLCDLYQTGDCVYAKYSPGMKLYEGLDRTVTHVVSISQDGWVREDIGLIITRADHVTPVPKLS
jgi:hypothetical protein